MILIHSDKVVIAYGDELNYKDNAELMKILIKHFKVSYSDLQAGFIAAQNTNKELLTIREYMSLKGISRAYVYKLIESGKLIKTSKGGYTYVGESKSIDKKSKKV